MNCVYCQEEFTWGEEAVQVRSGRLEISSRRMEPAFIPDEPDLDVIHRSCIAPYFCPNEEAEVRTGLRDEQIDGVGAMFQEFLDEGRVPRVEEPEAPAQPAPRGGRNRFHTRRR